MALGVRGINPVWSYVDLSGKQFDDTFYMYVLQNTIPYIPATIYADPDLNTILNNPVRFLSNGTLPVDIFFVEGVYRLEFRQNDGVNEPSQQDALIYLVENYVPGEGGSTPVDTVAFTSSNQITNPQFALMNLDSPYTATLTNPSINVAPGWDFIAQGTGTLTLNQVPLNVTNKNPSNAPYALEINTTGFDSNTVFLRQRFQQNGMLWANKYVSSSITARVQGVPTTIGATLVDSNGTPLGIVLPFTTTVDSSYNEFTGYALLPDTTNPNTPPAAYIDYLLSLPANGDIYVTSIQLAVSDLPVRPLFEQDSINRQIDHTYNTAYPIVPVGGMLDFAGITAPPHYLICDGTAISRVTYAHLFGIIGTLWGPGDGSTTFNLPDYRDRVSAGAGGTLFGGTTGQTGGAATHSITIAEMPQHSHPGSAIYQSTGGSTTVSSTINSGSITSSIVASQNGVLLAIAAQGSGTPMSLVQQTAIALKIIRYE